MGRGTLIRRALLAVILTGVVSPLLLAIGTAVVFLSDSNHPPHSVANTVGFIGLIWFFGSLVGVACATVLGLLVEWPKMKWLKSSEIWPNILISITGSEILLFSWALISILAGNPSRIVNEVGSGLLFVAIAAAIGGMCSAVSWWKLVVRPMRESREVSQMPANKVF